MNERLDTSTAETTGTPPGKWNKTNVAHSSPGTTNKKLSKTLINKNIYTKKIKRA